jgi:hypothetical protein
MKTLLACALVCATAAPAAFAANPWDGSWKLDRSKSHFEGQSFSYSKTAAGLWHVKAGTFAFDFAPDGKPYPVTGPEDIQIAHMKGDHELTWVSQLKGKTLSTTDETLSADGKTLTDHTTGTRPDGTKMDDTVVYERVGAGAGFLGTWKSTKVNSSQASLYKISVAADGTITWEIPDYKEAVIGKADGTPLPVKGPTVPDGTTLTLKKASPTELTYSVRIGGKVLSVGSMTLIEGDKAIKDVSWNPGTPSEKTTAYLAKE